MTVKVDSRHGDHGSLEVDARVASKKGQLGGQNPTEGTLTIRESHTLPLVSYTVAKLERSTVPYNLYINYHGPLFRSAQATTGAGVL
jgi:hypothetical protein